MSDKVWRRNEIESPCIKICAIHPTERICTGCFRTIDEIGAWSALSPEERTRIMAELPGRAPLVARRRGGSAARPRQAASGRTA